MHVSMFSVWAFLIAGLLGMVTGMNRTFKTRDKENPVLRTLAAVMGVLLIVPAVCGMFAGGGTVGSARYVVPFLLIIGRSLSARWIEHIHVAAVILLMLGLGILSVLARGGLPKDMADLLQGQNVRKLVIIAALVAGGAIFLMVSALEKVVDLVLALLGQGLVVSSRAVLGAVHAVLILVSADGRGLVRYLH